ncbi:copper homeostasis protein CutC [Phaeosphaeria sp. MPI-PUGE-AT-0046c]|nr:copper homeostasis protein CutC [Phaeosphaeria sp. MPI-PUGE-AT-0046c]
MLEIAAFTPSSAILASHSGADRIELCASYSSGGLTPSMSSLLTIRSNVPSSLPINIMIRPRAGNFRYSTAEFEAMRHDIALFAPLASGFVFGILDKAGKVDVARNSELVDIAAPLPCTFHRAVDEVSCDVEEAVESVIACGFKSILTSGGGKSAEEGLEKVRMMQEKFGSRVSLIVGGGVRSGNVDRIKSGAGVEWVHSAAITGEGEEVDGDEVRRIQEVLGKGTKEENGDQEMAG